MKRLFTAIAALLLAAALVSCSKPLHKYHQEFYVFGTLMGVNAGQVLFETSNPRHAHEWTVFRDRADEIPQDMMLVPGVIDSTTSVPRIAAMSPPSST